MAISGEYGGFDPKEQRENLQDRLEDEGQLGADAMRQYLTNVVVSFAAQANRLSPLTPDEIADELERCADVIRDESDTHE